MFPYDRWKKKNSASSANDRWKSCLSGSLRSLESGFHMIATITELFFSAIKRKTRLSSKYAPRYCCATLVTFKEQYPVTAHVPEDARRAREPWKIRLHRAWPSSILHQNFSELQINNILFPLSWAGIQKSARCVQILKIIYVRWLRQAQTVFAPHGLKGFVCAFTECWVKTIFISRIFIGK